MRLSVLAAVAIGLVPVMAEARGPERAGAAQVRVMRGSDAGTSWDGPQEHRGMSRGSRVEHRSGRVQDGRYGTDFDRYGEGWERDGRDFPVYGGDDDYGYDDRGYGWRERMDRDVDGDLGYDRDYPYEHPYGGYGYGEMQSGYGGGYTVTETTVTTGPSVVHYIERDKASAHRQTRRVKSRHGYRSAKRMYRAKAAPRCAC